jgi:hypothetical protein
MDLGGDLRCVGAMGAGVEPALGRHVKRPGRAVDDLAAGHHRVGVDRLEALAQVDRQHAQHPEAREATRPADVLAGHQGRSGHGAGGTISQAGERDRMATASEPISRRAEIAALWSIGGPHRPHYVPAPVSSRPDR